MTFTEPLTWTCHICGRERLDSAISVWRSDISAQFNLPPGTSRQNVRYCNDNPDCALKARSFSLCKGKE